MTENTSMIKITIQQDDGSQIIFSAKFKTNVQYSIVSDCHNYVVNTYGKVYHIKNKDGRNKIERTSLKPFKNRANKGYNIVYLYENGKRKRKQVSRLVADAFIPNPDNKPIVHHKNVDSLDDRLDNLQRVTTEEHYNIHQEMKKNNKGDIKNGTV